MRGHDIEHQQNVNESAAGPRCNKPRHQQVVVGCSSAEHNSVSPGNMKPDAQIDNAPARLGNRAGDGTSWTSHHDDQK